MRTTFFSTHCSIVVVFLLLSACSGEKRENLMLRESPMWSQFITAGHDSFMLGRYATAQTQYRKAFDLAFLHDSAYGLEEAGYNLAVTQLTENQPQKALETVQVTRKAVLLRENKPLPYLLLVEAAVYDRLGRYEKAEYLAQELLDVPNTEIAARAALILGVAADRRGDYFLLEKAVARLERFKKPLSLTHLADLDELQARSLRKNNPAQAIILADQSAKIRQKIGAYHDMLRALILEARIAETMGLQNKARGLWMRAAQSASVMLGKADTLSKLDTMNTATLAQLALSVTESTESEK